MLKEHFLWDIPKHRSTSCLKHFEQNVPAAFVDEDPTADIVWHETETPLSTWADEVFSSGTGPNLSLASGSLNGHHGVEL